MLIKTSCAQDIGFNKMKKLSYYLSLSVPASFTIEATVILPICFVIIVWFIVTAFTVHSNVISYSEAICQIMEKAPSDIDEDADYSVSGVSINAENLRGRKVLLKYKMLQDGLHTLTGGMDDED